MYKDFRIIMTKFKHILLYRKKNEVTNTAERLFSPAIIVLAILMGFKALYLAFFVTPLWDIPDEIGHLAYVMQIVGGGEIPVLGDAKIPPEIMSHIRQVEGASAIGNWIAQHPPLYYTIAAVPFWMAQQFTTDVEILYRAPRIIAAISAALLLLVLYRTARLTGLSERGALCLAGCVGWIPMVSHLSSGTNHDLPLFLISALVFHYLARFVLQHYNRDAYIAALWLSLAGATKMTAWVLLPPFFLVIAWELRGNLHIWGLHLLGITGTAFCLPAVWMIRNTMVYGNPIQTAITHSPSRLPEPLQESVFEFLSAQPILEHFLLNFYGLIGWGDFGDGPHWFQVDGFPLTTFTLVLGLFSFVLLLRFFHVLFRQKIVNQSTRFINSLISFKLKSQELWPCIRILVISLIIGIFLLLSYFSLKGSFEANIRLVAIAMILALGVGSIITVLFEDNDTERLFFYGLIAFLFFAVVVFLQIYQYYLVDGRLRATHGRYFYPVLPWIITSFSLILVDRVWGERLLMLFFPVLVIAETDAYISQILPFIGGSQ
jgi:hypothetical protein